MTLSVLDFKPRADGTCYEGTDVLGKMPEDWLPGVPNRGELFLAYQAGSACGRRNGSRLGFTIGLGLGVIILAGFYVHSRK